MPGAYLDNLVMLNTSTRPWSRRSTAMFCLICPTGRTQDDHCSKGTMERASLAIWKGARRLVSDRVEKIISLAGSGRHLQRPKL